MRPFGEAQSKAMRAYAQSGQYHTIVESRVRLTLKSLNHLSNMNLGSVYIPHIFYILQQYPKV